MKACYTVGDMMIGAAADHIAKQLTELNQAATIALGGRDPFITARDAAVEGLGHVEQRIGDLGQMQALAHHGEGEVDGDRDLGPPRRARRSTRSRSPTSRSPRPTSATTRSPTSPRAR